MRVSADKNDPGYEEYSKNGPYYTVFLNGVDVSDTCSTADSEKGMVLLCETDEDGELKYDYENECFVTKWHKGKVLIQKNCSIKKGHENGN